MAKSGLDWFRIDVDFDDNFELICAEFGSKGFEVIVRLWQKIYKDGYYIEWSDEVALLFAKKFSLSASVVSEIIKCAVRRGIFDNDMFEKFQILTSHGIQKWYLDSTERRKEVEVKKEYLLLNDVKSYQNVNINAKNVNISNKNVSRNKHSTVQNSTVQYSTVNRERDKPTHPRFIKPTLEEVKAYCDERQNQISPNRFLDYYDSKGWLIGKTSMKDWRAAVRNWERLDNENKPKEEVKVERKKYGEYI